MSPLDRRKLILGASALAALSAEAHGQVAPPRPPTKEPAAPPARTETIYLWPGKPPGGPGPAGVEQVTPGGAVTNIIRPRMIVQRPAKPNGAAVLILGGGGYRRIAVSYESQPTANWLLDYGVTTFVLYYRLPNSGWPTAAPFQDAQRAVRIIRARADEYELDETQIGIIGYSAGAHCAGMTSVRPDAKLYTGVDAIDEVSARPDFTGLIYPVLTMMAPNRTKISTLTLLGSNPTPDQCAAMSVDKHVTTDAPTTFLAHATDDPIAPVENSLMMFAALRNVKVPVEMHVFRSGGHGFTLGQPDQEDHAWPRLFATWAGFAKS